MLYWKEWHEDVTDEDQRFYPELNIEQFNKITDRYKHDILRVAVAELKRFETWTKPFNISRKRMFSSMTMVIDNKITSVVLRDSQVNRLMKMLLDLNILICIDKTHYFNPLRSRYVRLPYYILNLKAYYEAKKLLDINETHTLYAKKQTLSRIRLSMPLSRQTSVKSSRHKAGVARAAELLLRDELLREDTTYPEEFIYHLGYDVSSMTKRRPYADICSCSTSDNGKSAEREDALDMLFGKDNWLEWDRNASIYNTTLLLNKGIFLPNDRDKCDMYEMFAGHKFASKEERRLFKLNNMRCYFSDARAVRSMAAHTGAALYLEKNGVKPFSVEQLKSIKRAHENREAVDALYKESTMAGKDDDPVKAVVERYKERRAHMIDVIGKRYRDSIFLIEGLVNIRFMHAVRSLGYKCVSVYDGFFIEKSCGIDLERLYEKVAREACNDIKSYKLPKSATIEQMLIKPMRVVSRDEEEASLKKSNLVRVVISTDPVRFVTISKELFLSMYASPNLHGNSRYELSSFNKHPLSPISLQSYIYHPISINHQSLLLTNTYLFPNIATNNNNLVNKFIIDNNDIRDQMTKTWNERDVNVRERTETTPRKSYKKETTPRKTYKKETTPRKTYAKSTDGRSAERKLLIINDIKSGMRAVDIASKHGVSRAYISKLSKLI